MISLLKPLAHAAVYRLAKSGFNLSRTEPRAKATRNFVTEAEMSKLSRDLDAIYSGTTNFGVWSEAADVKAYVNKDRINSYHKVIAAASGAGVELDDKSVLEIGTCSGYLLRILEGKNVGTTLSGTDYYEDFVNLAAALVPSAKVFKASITELASAPDTYDVIFCTEVLEHIVDTESQIPIMMTLVKPGGALVVSVPDGRHDATPAYTSEDGVSWVGHVNFWSPQSWPVYIERMAGQYRYEVGSFGVHFEGDALFAVIFKD